MADPGDYHPDGYYFEPILNLEASAEDLEYDGDILTFCDEDEDQIEEHLDHEIDGDLSIDHEEEHIGLELEADHCHNQSIINLLQIEPISTEQRLERYPEMRMLKPRTKNGARGLVFEAPEIPKGYHEYEEGMIDGGVERVVEKRLTPFQCPECLNCYRTETTLNSHIKLHEQNLPIPETSFFCPMDRCEIRCDSQLSLLDHVRVHHGEEGLQEQTLFFPSWTVFEKWKEGMEEATSSRFIRSTGRTNMTGRYCRFSCFFSISFNRQMARGIRKKSSRKTIKSCTAFVSAFEAFGKVKVHTCLRHIGHGKDLQNLPLSVNIKKEIATLAMQGLAEDDIVQTMRESNTPDNRRYYIQPYDVRNVCQKLLKNQYRADRVVELCDKNENLEVEEENPEISGNMGNPPEEHEQITAELPFEVEEEVII